jgi:hypothetical protein
LAPREKPRSIDVREGSCQSPSLDVFSSTHPALVWVGSPVVMESALAPKYLAPVLKDPFHLTSVCQGPRQSYPRATECTGPRAHFWVRRIPLTGTRPDPRQEPPLSPRGKELTVPHFSTYQLGTRGRPIRTVHGGGAERKPRLRRPPSEPGTNRCPGVLSFREVSECQMEEQ